jgi:cytosine/adenosine deaminase-related metal-dependent hydrolase
VYAPDETFLKTLPPELSVEVGKRLAKTHFPLESYETEFILPMLEEFSGPIKDRRIRLWLAPINLERASDRLLTLTKEWAARYDTGIHLHMSETIYQKMFSQRRFGMSSVKHLKRINFLGPEVTLGHTVWVDDEDLDIIAESGCAICHNASSNLRLRSGIAPLRSMLERGIPISMGIDEAGLNDDRDMLQELRVVKHVHAVPGIFAKKLTTAQIFRMATEGGAGATGFGNEIGRIEVGRRADLVLIDFKRLSDPYLDPDTTVLDALIYRARSTDVQCVLIDGRIVYKDGQFTGVDRKEVMNKLRSDFARPPLPHELERKRLSAALFPYIRDFYKDWAV